MQIILLSGWHFSICEKKNISFKPENVQKMSFKEGLRMSNIAMTEFGFRVMWMILRISEDVVRHDLCLGGQQSPRRICIILHIIWKPNSITANNSKMLGNLEFVFFREILLLDWADLKTSGRVFFQFLKQGSAYKKEGPDPNKGSNQQ